MFLCVAGDLRKPVGCGSCATSDSFHIRYRFRPVIQSGAVNRFGCVAVSDSWRVAGKRDQYVIYENAYGRPCATAVAAWRRVKGKTGRKHALAWDAAGGSGLFTPYLLKFSGADCMFPEECHEVLSTDLVCDHDHSCSRHSIRPVCVYCIRGLLCPSHNLEMAFYDRLFSEGYEPPAKLRAFMEGRPFLDFPELGQSWASRNLREELRQKGNYAVQALNECR